MIFINICISSNESGHGTLSSVNSPSFQAALHFSQENQDCHIRTDLILGSPLNSPPSSSPDYLSVRDLHSPKSKTVEHSSQKSRKTAVSPLIHWTPDWEEYGSYIISPQNLATLKYVQSLHEQKATDLNNNTSVHVDCMENSAKYLKLQKEGSLLQIDSTERSPIINCSSESDSESCEFEVVAEFPKSDFASDLDL